MITTEKTLSQVMEVLRKRGYTEDFNLVEECLAYAKDGSRIYPKDLTIDKIYRFTGFNDLDDESILYAMHHSDGTKGVFVNAYGTYSDPQANKIIDQIPVHDDNEDWTNS